MSGIYKGGRCKLCGDTIRAIRKMHANGDSYRAIGSNYGLSTHTVHNIISGKTYAWVDSSAGPCKRQIGRVAA